MLLSIVVSSHDLRKVGAITKKLSEDDRKLLQQLKSSDIQDRVS